MLSVRAAGRVVVRVARTTARDVAVRALNIFLFVGEVGTGSSKRRPFFGDIVASCLYMIDVPGSLVLAIQMLKEDVLRKVS